MTKIAKGFPPESAGLYRRERTHRRKALWNAGQAGATEGATRNRACVTAPDDSTMYSYVKDESRKWLSVQ